MVAKFLISSVLLFSLVCSEKKNCEICYFVEFFLRYFDEKKNETIGFCKNF
jgi:hypothetical protein